jgi:hypothetical protein
LKITLVVALLLLACAVSARQAEGSSGEPEADPWAPIRPLLGRWEGAEIGREDASHIEREYELIMGGRFIRTSTLAVFEAAGPDTGSEVHRDIGLFSYDPDRDMLLLREFMSEGSVVTYVLERATADSLILVSERSEGAAGFRARLRYSLVDVDVHVEALDLAPPGKGFFTCHRMKMTRLSE